MSGPRYTCGVDGCEFSVAHRPYHAEDVAARAAAPPVEPESAELGFMGMTANLGVISSELAVPPSPDPVAGLREALRPVMDLLARAEATAASTGRTGWFNKDIYDACAALLASDKPRLDVERDCHFKRGWDGYTNCSTHGWSGFRTEVRQVRICPARLSGGGS